VQTPLNASASSAGALLSSSTFEVPPFQREYSWREDEVAEFWSDLKNNIESESYFLGLVILTEEDRRKHVVDGQQRLVTLTLLANVLYHEAKNRDRKASADRIQADFLRSIDYTSDETNPRLRLSDQADDATLQAILLTAEPPNNVGEEGSVSQLHALVHALRPATHAAPLARTAIGLDSSVFLRISGHAKSVDIIDYLNSAHSAPLILPGQAIQEFRNNQLQAVDTVASGLRSVLTV
jgi:hypothetical protein